MVIGSIHEVAQGCKDFSETLYIAVLGKARILKRATVPKLLPPLLKARYKSGSSVLEAAMKSSDNL